MHTSQAVQTWGISGPTFLAGYTVLAVAVFVINILSRRLGSPTGAVSREPLRSTEAAYLAGGVKRAVASAAAGLRTRGLLNTDKRGLLLAVGTPPVDTEPLERAVWDAVWRKERRRIRELEAVESVRIVLREIQAKLVTEQLHFGSAQRMRRHLYGMAMAAVFGLGVFRVFAGVNNNRPVGYLVVVLIFVGVLTVMVFTSGSPRTRGGEKLLRKLRKQHAKLRHMKAGSVKVHGPVNAALGVGLFGAAVFVALDPEFVTHSQLGAYSGSSSSGSGGYSGGGGDSGGGSGGGCGGGGGGCGG